MLNTDRPTRASSSDHALLLKVRQRLVTAGYQPGQALPTGLIAHHLQANLPAVKQAIAELARARKVEFRPNGEHGPGYYMPAPHRPNSLARHGVRARYSA
ncbi:hypothetical protein [Streptomyces anulatus]|uniref:hypothetical protein n=1 Tax=Streptomyces anulatus TaxID=1892 RepID=UPI003F49B58F